MDEKEKESLRAAVQQEVEKIEQDINKKYHDKFKCKYLKSS